MRRRSHVRIGLTVLGVALAAMTLAAAAQAQLAVTRQNERVLFLLPRAERGADTTFAIELTEEVRRRMRSSFRQKLAIVPTADVCTVLQESAYSCTAVLGLADADRLARAVRADAYILGTVWMENVTPVGRFHMVDIGRSGLSGWMTVRGEAGDAVRRFAATIVDSLQTQVRAAELSRECSERRDRGAFRDAKARAARVFQMYPNHPSTALCAWVVSEAMQEPLDSQVVLLERAVAGDSTSARAWERLGRARIQAGDSTGALEAFEQQTRLNAGDRELRVGVVTGAIAVGDYQRASDLGHGWLERNPGDLEMRQLVTRACVEGGLWECALESLAAQFQMDSSLATDSVFYQQVIGAAQVLGDVDAELEWSARAVAHIPRSVSLLRAHASALASAEMTDSVVVIYGVLLAMDSTDVRSALAGARILLEDLPIDTITPLDTARLVQGGAFLGRAVAATRDTSVLMNAAVLYYRKGSELIRTRQLIATGVEWLEQSIAADVLEQLTVQSNFFLGLGLMLRIFEFDQEVTASESCELVEQEADMIARGKEALELGGELSPANAEQFLQQFNAFEQRIPQLRQAYGCQ